MIRIIGDVHCKLNEYYKIILDAEERKTPTIQSGDLCTQHFNIPNFGPNHRFFCGNHDDYQHKHPNNLGDYGPLEIDGRKLFFIRGACSIDGDARRRRGLHWSAKEELSYGEQLKCMDVIRATSNIDFVLTHEAPRSVANIIGSANILRDFGFDPATFTTSTSEFLDCVRAELIQLGRIPKMWIFGHYHKKFDKVVDGIRFICLPELGYMDI